MVVNRRLVDKGIMYDMVKIDASFQDSFLGCIVSSPARVLHSAVTGTVLCSWESLGLVERPSSVPDSC